MRNAIEDGQRASTTLVIGFVGALLVSLVVILFTFQRYRLLMGNADYVVFWVVFIALALASAILLVFALEQSRVNNATTVILLFVFTMVFFGTLQIYPQANGSSVVGWDSYYNVRVATDIAEIGRVDPSLYTGHFTQDYVLKWPGFPVLSAVVSEAIGVPVLQLARYLPTAINLPSIVVMWAIVGRLHKGEHILPIGIFSLVFLSQSFSFHSWMVEESLGFPMFLVGVLSGVAYARTARVTWAIVFTLSLVGITFTHHLSTFMLAFLFLLFTIFAGFLGRAEDEWFNAAIRRRLAFISLTSFALLIAYSSTTGVTIMRAVSIMLLSAISPGSTIGEYRGYQAYWDLRSTAIVLLTAAVALYLVIAMVRKIREGSSLAESWDKATVAWGGALFALVFAFSSVFKSPFIPNYSRILTFPWIFVFHGGMERKQRSRQLWVIIVVCGVFGFFNLLSVNPYIYAADHKLTRGEQYLLNSESAFQVLSQIPSSDTIVCDVPTGQVVEGWMMRNVSIIQSPPDPGTDLFEQGRTVVIRVENEELYPFLALYRTNKTIAQVSDSGAFVVYTRTQ